MLCSISGKVVYQFARSIVGFYRNKNAKGIALMMVLIWPVIEGFLIGTGVWPLTIVELAVMMAAVVLWMAFTPQRALALRRAEKYAKFRTYPLLGIGILWLLPFLPLLLLPCYVMWQKGILFFLPVFNILIGSSIGITILLFRPWILRVLFGCDRRTKILGALRDAR